MKLGDIMREITLGFLERRLVCGDNNYIDLQERHEDLVGIAWEELEAFDPKLSDVDIARVIERCILRALRA